MINNNNPYLFQLLRDSLYYSISKIVPGLIGVICVIFFFRWMGAVEYGKYSIIFSFTNLIAAFSFGWLNQSILRYRSNFNSSKKILSLIMVGFLFGIISVIIFIIITSILQFPIVFSIIF